MPKMSIKPGRVFLPQPLYLIGTNNQDGSANFATITWIASNWNGTPHIMVGLGSARQARENVKRDGLFTMNLVSRDMVWLADCLGSSIGTEEQLAGFTYTSGKGEVLNAPILQESKLIFECETTNSMEMEANSTIFFGEIKNILLDESYGEVDLRRLDMVKLDPVLFAPYQYFSVGKLLGPCDGWVNEVKP
jgi:flavin reductase (DIM6/NTAB) family NADH-FMN oxidoreductase RutF